MPVNNSSVLGASLVSSDTTALFTLGTKILGTDNTEWAYCEATATFVTGEMVFINANGTALTALTANLNAPSVAGVDIGFVQFAVNQGEFAFVAKRGSNLYVLCTSTIAAGTAVGMSANSGRLCNMGETGVGQTLAGIHITTSASTATASTARATVTWPRGLQTTGVIG